MNSHCVFVYGHYDSRGGTSAILADSREQADAFYLNEFNGGEPAGYDDSWIIDEDFLFETILEIPDDIDISTLVNRDLEWDDDLAFRGLVLSEKDHPPFDNPNTRHTPPRLRFVRGIVDPNDERDHEDRGWVQLPDGREIFHCRCGEDFPDHGQLALHVAQYPTPPAPWDSTVWEHQRWDDDGCAFVLQDARTSKETT